MTHVRFKYAHRVPSTKTPAAGTVTCEPSRRTVDPADPATYIIPKPITRSLDTTGQVTIDLAPTTADWAWKVTVTIHGLSTGTVWVSVPATADTLNFTDLPTLDPDTLAPDATPEPAWWVKVGELEALGGAPGPPGPDGPPGPPGPPGPVPTAADIGLGRVNNTNDMEKPVSTAVQAALNGKVPINGNGFSMQSPDGKSWRVTIGNDGALSATII